MRKLFNDEIGFVISAELILVMTIAVLAMVVGLASVRDAVTHELNDISHAFGTVSQTYQVTGLRKSSNNEVKKGDAARAYAAKSRLYSVGVAGGSGHPSRRFFVCRRCRL